jgi:hypothetical protein
LLLGDVVPLDDWSTAPGAVLPGVVLLPLVAPLVVSLEVLFELLPLSVVQLQASFICCLVEPSCLASCAAMQSFCDIWLLPVVSVLVVVDCVVVVVDESVVAGLWANVGAPATAATAAMIAGVMCFMEQTSLKGRTLY